MSDGDPLAGWRRNPFFILTVATHASRVEVERQGQKLLALLEIGSTEATRYETPFGPATRDPDAVRQALAALRDPDRRVIQELWADIATPIKNEQREDATQPWEGAGAAIGWAGICTD
jgi:hypothetical protein